MSKNWSSWIEFFEELMDDQGTFVLTNIKPHIVREHWDNFRRVELIKTSPFNLKLEGIENGNCEITLMCSCCGKRYKENK